jgi:hypothetical protein
MRYLKSWLFDIGLVLVIAGIVAAQLVRPRETYVVSPPVSSPDSGVNAVQISAENTDYDMFPVGLVGSGLAVLISAVVRIKSKSPN